MKTASQPRFEPARAPSKARREVVEAASRIFQTLGLPRSTGQVFGLLYLAHQPLSLDDLAAALSISKGSASMAARQLASLRAVRPVWVPGDRRDYFEAVGDPRELAQASFSEFVKPWLDSSEKRLASIFTELEKDRADGAVSAEEYKFCADRLRNLVRFQKRLASFRPMVEKFLT